MLWAIINVLFGIFSIIFFINIFPLDPTRSTRGLLFKVYDNAIGLCILFVTSVSKSNSHTLYGFHLLSD